LARDTIEISGVKVTTLERTAIEIALRRPEADALALLIALYDCGADLRLATRRLNQRARVAGRERAVAILTSVWLHPPSLR
jgi:hypothetical protein